MAEELRARIEDLRLPNSGYRVSDVLTVSIGTASVVPTLQSSLADFVASADQALYRAKQEGRNRMVCAQAR